MRAGMRLSGRWFPFIIREGLYYLRLIVPGTKLDTSAFAIDDKSSAFVVHL